MKFSVHYRNLDLLKKKYQVTEVKSDTDEERWAIVRLKVYNL